MLSSLASRYTRQFAFAASRTFASQSGEVVFITGASSGLGYETAKIMAAAGYKVVATARRKDKLESLVAEIQAFGGSAAAVRLDVTEDADFEAAFDAAEKEFGGVDHVFLNAGQVGALRGPGEMLGAQDTAAFDQVLNVNVRGVLLGYKHGISALRKRGGGTIISNSSNAGGWSRGGSTGDLGHVITAATPYCITSASLDQMVRLCAYYKNEGIRVYGLKSGAYSSEFSLDSGFAGMNLFFKGLPGDPKHLGRIVQSLVDNSTQWVPGSNICCDNDATFDANLQYKIADTDQEFPNVTIDDLCGYDGGAYVSQDERTAAYIANM